MSNSNSKIGATESVTNDSNDELQIPGDHETATQASGFGKFNLIILLAMIPSSLSTAFSTSSMSYVFPIAQCDLNLTVDNKGMLNSIIYIGMLSSGFFWGFLTDLLGRRKLLIFIFFLQGVIVVLSGFSQNFIYLIIMKLSEGLVVTGAYSAVLTYANEFHSSYHRKFIPILNGIFSNISATVLPFLGWLVFSDEIHITIFNNFIVLKSWNIFIFITSIPCFLAGIIYLLLPESPKFLMTVGKNNEALEVFRLIFRWNTGNPSEEYSVKALVDESKLNENNLHGGHITPNRTNFQALKEGWQQVKPLFYPPYIVNGIVTITINLGLLMGLNTIRLWTPQLFSAINDYQQERQEYDLCNTLVIIRNGSFMNNETCYVNYDNSRVYVNNIIVSVAAIIINVCTFPFIGKLRKKVVLVSTGFFSGLCGIFVYFSSSITVTITLLSLLIGCMFIAINVLISISIDLFPTNLRTFALSLAMTFGRVGSSGGNLIFPKLLAAGCLYPFLTVGCVLIGSALLGILLPNTDMTSLH